MGNKLLIIVRNYLLLLLDTQRIQINTYCSFSIGDNHCLWDSCRDGTKNGDDTIVLLLW